MKEYNNEYKSFNQDISIIKELRNGALVLPSVLFTLPSTIRRVKNKSRENEYTSPFFIKDKLKYRRFAQNSIQRIGAIVSGLTIGTFGENIYDFVSENPYVLAVPVLTNVLSAGFEVYRSKNLESKLD